MSHIEAGNFTAQDFRDDSMSIKPSGPSLTHDDYARSRREYLDAHPEVIVQLDPPGKPLVSVFELSNHIHSRWEPYLGKP